MYWLQQKQWLQQQQLDPYHLAASMAQFLIAADDGDGGGWWEAYINIFEAALKLVHSTIDGPLQSMGVDQTWGVSIFVFTACTYTRCVVVVALVFVVVVAVLLCVFVEKPNPLIVTCVVPIPSLRRSDTFTPRATTFLSLFSAQLSRCARRLHACHNNNNNINNNNNSDSIGLDTAVDPAV